MTLRGDLRSLARGDADPLRWRVARRLLRWAGALLARSHPDTLWAQTSEGIGATLAAWGEVTLHAAPIADSAQEQFERGSESPPCAWTPLSRNDAHGLLLQLAAARYEADRAAERVKP